ncbi:MAG TPA: winged helix-turn-helix domain-containing protein, partial [Dehalococcoidia bacterium]|nr:winged helix-turn-helix domain-containing protein [Dehalococcoidia bacterium]
CAHYLRLYIGYLRQKLEADPRNPRTLRTEWGVGYRFVAEGAPAAMPAANPARAEWA